MKISAVILSRNEEKNIERAIRSISFCDEVLVIDDFSQDATCELAKKLNATIVERKLDNDFAAQRNFALSKARNEWVLFIDADEEVTDELKREILSLTDRASGYYIKRRDFFWGQKLRYGETMRAANKGILRLVNKNAGSWKGKVHEEFVAGSSSLIEGTLNGYLNHYPHPTVAKFIAEINHYSTLRAHELKAMGKTGSILEILFLPFFKFLYTYFLLRGFLDGPAGFAYSFLMSFHSFLVRAKLFQYTKIDKSP